jgi:hypothetical protein
MYNKKSCYILQQSIFSYERGREMKIKVLAIAPYPGLKGLLESISHEDSRIEMDIEVAGEEPQP